METLLMIAAECAKFERQINNMSLMGWVNLADSLGVARNDREHAVKILALRSLRAAGKIE